MPEERQTRSNGLVLIGVVVMAAGIVAMLGSVGLLSIAWVATWWWRLRWPLILIVAGAAVIVFAMRGGNAVRSIEAGPWRRHGRLYRSRHDKWIAGVLGGLAAYFGVGADVLRLVFLALVLLGAPWVVLAYIIMAVLVPEEPEGSAGGMEPGIAETAPPPPSGARERSAVDPSEQPDE